MSLEGPHSLATSTISLTTLCPGSGQEKFSEKDTERVRAIEFSGNSTLDSRVLRESLRMIRQGGWWNPFAMEADLEMNLGALLREEGLLRARTSWDVQPDSPGYVRVLIKISEGPVYRLSRLEIRSQDGRVDETARKSFSLRDGDVARLTEIKKGLESLKESYEDRGYMNWSYIPETRYNEDSHSVELIFTIVEGVSFHFVQVAFVGIDEPSEEERLREAIKLRPGDPCSPRAVRAAAQAINDSGKYARLDYEIEILDEKKGHARVVFRLEQ